MKTQSFIDTILTEMTSKKNAQGYIAKRIQEQKHDSVLNRIAMTFSVLGRERSQANRVMAEVRAKPEQLLSFTQNLSNAMCWQARRLMMEQQAAAAESQAMGMNFAEERADEMGVDGIGEGVEAIAKQVEDDAFGLGNVYAWLASQMSQYLEDLEEFHLYVDRQENEEGEWEIIATADTFTDALGCMDNALADLREKEESRQYTEASSVDFAAIAQLHATIQ